MQRGGKARGEVVIGRKEQRTDEPVADAADQNILELLPAQAQLFAHAAVSAAYKKNEKDHDAGGKTGEGLRERIAAADVDGFGKERVQTVEDRGQNGQKKFPLPAWLLPPFFLAVIGALYDAERGKATGC